MSSRASRLVIVGLAWVSLLGPSMATDRGEDAPAGRPLVVGVKAMPPFVFRNPDTEWDGVAIELWERIAARNGLEFEYREYDLEGLLSAVEAREADIGVGALSMTQEREERFDFSHAYFVSGMGIAIHRDAGGGWVRSLRGFVSWRFLQIVAFLVAILLVCGFLVWLFERRRNAEMFGGRAHHGVGSGFWWAAVTMTTVGYGDKAPRTAGGRLVALFWMFASLVMVSGFTAAIASALTVGALDSPIAGPEDLAGSRVVTVGGSSSAEWLSDHGIRFLPCSEIVQGLEMLEARRVDAVVYDLPILSYLVHQDPSLPVAVLPRIFELQPYALALPTGSPYTERLNQDILEITSDEEFFRRVLELMGRKY